MMDTHNIALKEFGARSRTLGLTCANSFKISLILTVGLMLFATLLPLKLKAQTDVDELTQIENAEQYRGRDRGSKREDRKIERMIKRLDLSKEQEEKVRALKTQNDAEMQKKREAMKAAHEELEQAMKGSASEREVRDKFSQLEKVQAEFARLRFENVLAIRQILTPEQREKFKGFGKGGHRRGRH